MAGAPPGRLAPQKVQALAAIIEDQRKHLTELLERADHHEHRAKHWDLIANRQRE